MGSMQMLAGAHVPHRYCLDKREDGLLGRPCTARSTEAADGDLYKPVSYTPFVCRGNLDGRYPYIEAQNRPFFSACGTSLTLAHRQGAARQCRRSVDWPGQNYVCIQVVCRGRDIQTKRCPSTKLMRPGQAYLGMPEPSLGAGWGGPFKSP